MFPIAHMRSVTAIFYFITALLLAVTCIAQHPARNTMDSLEKTLPDASGIQKANSLNALAEEYWWPPLVFPDSISYWASMAASESEKINYIKGMASAILHSGVADVYRKNFLKAESSLRNALQLFNSMGDETGIAWCNVWLGQALFSQNNFKEAFPLFHNSISSFAKSGDLEGQGKGWSMLGFFYHATGNYDSSLYCFSRAMTIRQTMKDEVCVAASLTHIGNLYLTVGAINEALNYYTQSIQHANRHSLTIPATNWKYFLDEPNAIIYLLRQMPDSALYFLNHALQVTPNNQTMRVMIGEILLAKNQYDSAIKIFSRPSDHFRKENNRLELVRVLLNVAKAFYGKGNSAAALQYTKESLAIAEEADFKPTIADGYILLSKIYNQRQKNDSAYFYLQKYISLKELLNNSQFLWRLTDYKKQTDFARNQEQLALLDKENKLKEEKLQQAAQLKGILAIGLLVVGLTGIILYRYQSLKRKNDKLQNDKKQVELQNRATDLEMQALRAQMNPHFIFNCLNSINRFILKSETDAASDYLTKFSRLIRMVLTYSKKSFISLEDELEMLKLYLDMERLRFKDAFEYSIIFKNSVDTDNVFVPPLLLQPFAENAIWHGLMHKDGPGQLEIELRVDNKILMCIIKDNGIGRSKAAVINSKSTQKTKSMGLQITADRLALLNQENEQPTSFTVEDIYNEDGIPAGTRVVLKMCYKDVMEAAS
jgi:tetratricopeptide (TPR) repeat protein